MQICHCEYKMHTKGKWLPGVSRFQNRRFTAYMLKCLVIIYLAALRPHFRMFLNLAPPSRHFQIAFIL